MLKKNVKLGIALVGMRHLNYKIYLKKQILPPSPSENGCLGYIIEGRTAIATPPKPIEGHIFFHLKILFYVKQFVIRA